MASTSFAQDCFRPRRERKWDENTPMSLVSKFKGMGAIYTSDGFYRDTRKEIEDYASDSTCAAQLTQIACTVIPRKDFDFNSSKGEYRFNKYVPSMAERMNMCKDERFAQQLSPGTCSCFLTADNEVTTAGHCFGGKNMNEKKKGCQDSFIVFGFDSEAARKGYKFKSDQVFSCNDIDKTETTADPYKSMDVMRVRLNETAANRYRKPLDLEKQKNQEKPVKDRDLCMIGSPLGAPLKMALGQVKGLRTIDVKGKSITVIRSDMDGMAGASGSMVVDCKTGALQGVYLSGAPDLEDAPEGCKRAAYYDSKGVEVGLGGENIMWVGDIPPANWSTSVKSRKKPGVK